MRLTIIVTVFPTLLLATLLLALGLMNVVRGLGDSGESPQLNLLFGLLVTSLGLLLAGVGATILFAGKRRSQL